MGLCCLRRSDRQALLHGVDAGSRRLPRRLEQQLQPLPQSADLLHPWAAVATNSMEVENTTFCYVSSAEPSQRFKEPFGGD